jgi:hypothetical protein
MVRYFETYVKKTVVSMYQPMLLYFNMLFYLLTAVATAIIAILHKIHQHRRAHVADISPNKYQYVTLIKIRISHLYVITEKVIHKLHHEINYLKNQLVKITAKGNKLVKEIKCIRKQSIICRSSFVKITAGRNILAKEIKCRRKQTLPLQNPLLQTHLLDSSSILVGETYL